MESFFKEVCIRKSDARISFHILYAAYIWWCVNHGEKPKIRKEFAAYIRSQGVFEEREYRGTMFFKDLDIIEEYKQKMKEFGYA